MIIPIYLTPIPVAAYRILPETALQHRDNRPFLHIPLDSTLESMLNSQKYQTKGCPSCTRARLRESESFAELHPELMDEYAPTNTTDPYTTFPNNKEQVDWICRDCGYKWEASFQIRHRGGGVCPL